MRSCGDFSDHGRRCADGVPALGTAGEQGRERGRPVSCSDTRHRVESGVPGQTKHRLYGRIVSDLTATGRLQLPPVPGFTLNSRDRTTPIINAPDEPPQRQKEGRFLHGLPDSFRASAASRHLRRPYSVLPPADGERRCGRRARPGVVAVWIALPKTRAAVRGDSCSSAVPSSVGTDGTGCGMHAATRNLRPEEAIGRQIRWSHNRCIMTGILFRRFRNFCCRTQKG